jgi:chromosome segregation protein
MYLSRLEIIGFKSFAQKTGLGFDSGISAIVGPNGCGKTNIVDAIRWVLGEQRYSALRSEKMEDVIFNGTKNRKPLGMAEATLVIENTKGILPSEYTQVTIGRRVYRSGESEYLLNKVPCRLKDIHDLFMDTGMGADAYSVIELKMVESILSDKTDERRHLFEEAAGVTKYKHRRKAAYRKLESVQADLVRVNDIVSEVQKAVAALERQAKKAQQHNEVRDRLQTLEIDLMEREYAQLHARKTPLEEKLASLRREQTAIDGDLSADEGKLEALRNLTKDQELRLAMAQRDVSEHHEKVNHVQQQNLVAAERRKGLEDAILRFRKESGALEAEMRELGNGRTDLLARIEQCAAEEAGVATTLEEARSGLTLLETQLASKRNEIQGLSDRMIEVVHVMADRQAAQDKRRGRIDNLAGRSGKAREEIVAYEAEIRRLEEEISRLLAEDKQLRRKFTEAEVRYYEAEKQKNEFQERTASYQTEELELRAEMERRSARQEFLQGLLESHEGLPEGTRYLMARNNAGLTLHTVADVASAEERFRPAIETALGQADEMIIVRTVVDAERAMAILKQEQVGKVTFACLDRIPEMPPRVHEGASGKVYGWAGELVRCDAAYRNLFRFLLDGVLVVHDQKAANDVLRNRVGIHCVTLDGELITGAGIARGGGQGKNEGRILGKQSQIEELRAGISALVERMKVLRDAQEDIQRDNDAIDLKAQRDEVKQVEREMSGVEVRLAQLEFEKGRAAEIILRNREEIANLLAEISALENEVAGYAPEVEALSEEKANTERRVGGMQMELELLEREWNNGTKRVSDLGVRLATVKGEHQNAIADLKRADLRAEDIRTSLDRLGAEIAAADEEIKTMETGVRANEETLRLLLEEMRTLTDRRQASEDELLRTKDEIHSIEMKLKDDRRHHDDFLSEMHELELRVQDLKAKAEHVKARALEEFELALELKSYPDDEFVDFAALRDEIQALREKIKSLGNINFAAFEEFNTEKQRLDFLTEQRKDLLEAEKTLLATIEEINTTAQTRFLQTFGQIRSNFIETFKSLFDPGDECDLRLEEEVDPLEARIEIIAKPRGKRPTSIDLLSGGEKTLTATALLFAIYLVKPSPFCILDEVDAPLDDANIDRFTRILRKFSNNTQFIVVTHNKRTMEAANALYGVTMEEEGVSKLVTVRFNQAGVKSAQLVSG